jgi:hypothetical protein
MPATTAKEYIKGLGMAELETIALEVLSEALQTVCPRREPELAMKIANATLDRTRGKPAQAVTVDTTLRQITVNAQVQFVRVQPALENSTVTIENDNILNPSK